MPIVQRLNLADAAQATDRIQRRAFGNPLWLDHPDSPVPRQRILNQRAITRLEDMQGQLHAGE